MFSQHRPEEPPGVQCLSYPRPSPQRGENKAG